MNWLIKTLIVCLLGLLSSFAQDDIVNVTFTDMEGTSYDLYTMLGEGKHVLIQTQMNICPYTPPNIQGMNVVWEKYGCNDYGLVVFIVNICTGDKKEEFTKYCDTFNVQYDRVFSTDGGYPLSKALNCNMTPRQFLIFPDKSWKQANDYAADLEAAQVQEHACDTGTNIINDRTNRIQEISGICYSSNRLSLYVHHEDQYTLKLFSVNGRCIHTVKEKLIKGYNLVNLGKKNYSSGIVFLSAYNSSGAKVKKNYRIVNIK